MCTVTYIPSDKAVYLTSNRDERTARQEALLPKAQALATGHHLAYPKDPEGGGTWVGLKSNGDAAVLLNGAFVNHKPKGPYRKSRGLVFLEAMEAARPLQAFHRLSLCGIEPFTLVALISGRLHDLRWDGGAKHVTKLDAAKPHIWSSATLYNPAAQAAKQAGFEAFLKAAPYPAQPDVLRFHRRHILQTVRGGVETASITLLRIAGQKSFLTYYDLHRNAEATCSFNSALAVCKEKEAVYD